MHHFQVNNRSKFDKEFPFFRKPIEIGCFSIDINRSFRNDTSQLKYYANPYGSTKVNFDLKLGYESMVKKDETVKTYINDILHWTLLNRRKFAIKNETEADKRNLHTDFVCWRGLLTKLLCTPYERNDDLLVAATLYNGTIYLAEFDSEQKKANEANKTPRQEEMCCWGWKFEQYLVSDQPDTNPDPQAVFNNIECFGTVIRGRLNKHSLVFAGEVDCKRADGHKQYVELKTSREITHPRQDANFKRYKLIKWWAQSFLVGIPEVICGFRDDDGIVHSLKSFKTKEIPKIASDIQDPWKPNVCFNFLDQFLSFLKSVVKKDNPRVVYLVRSKPASDITCEELRPGSEYVFLPDWYIHPENPD